MHYKTRIHEPKTLGEYNQLTAVLDALLDIVGEDETHELMGLVDVISYMIARYDEAHDAVLDKESGLEALKFLIKQHGLKQADLKEIGSQGVVSEVLRGKRKLNLTQVKKLAERFHVSVDTFID